MRPTKQRREDGGWQSGEPEAGARIEARRTGVWRLGTIQYADDLQVLVKWDDGSSSSLRVGRDAFRMVRPHERTGAAAA